MFKNVNQASNPNTQIVRVPWRLREAESSALELVPRPDTILYQADGTLMLREEGRVQQEEIVTRALPDGRMIDLVRDPQDPDHIQLAVWSPDGASLCTDDLSMGGRVLRPPRRRDYILRSLVLPLGVLPAEPASTLARKLRETIRACVALPNYYYSLLAAFALYTWIADRLDTAAYLYVTGLRASGKTTLLQVMRLLCRRSLATADSSSAAISEACSLVSPTLIIDEAELGRRGPSRSLTRLLRAGTNRNQLVLRKGGYYEVFGPKILCSEELPDDPALLSRCVVVPMTEDDTSNLKKPNDPEIVARSQELQSKLLGFRFNALNTTRLADLSGTQQLAPRRADLISLLASPFEINSEWPDLLQRCFANTDQDPRPSLPPDRAAVLDGLWDISHKRTGYEFVFIRELVGRIREMYKAEDQRVPLSLEAVGKIMRNDFRLKGAHTRLGNGFWMHNQARSQIHGLVDKYGLQLPPDSSVDSSKETCSFCKEREAASSPADLDDEMLKDLEEPDSESPRKQRRLFDDLQDVPEVDAKPRSDPGGEEAKNGGSPPSPRLRTPRKTFQRRTRKPRVRASEPGKRKHRVREPRCRSRAVIKGSAFAGRRSCRRNR